MIWSSVHSKQPLCVPWTHAQLEHEHAVAFSQAINSSTWLNYSSALNSYLDFVKNHNFPIDPTPDTLSFYIVYMSLHIKLDSVGTYLSGICQQLEPFHPHICVRHKSPMVCCTLDGCKWLHGIPTHCKCALSLDDLHTVISHYSSSTDHDNLLFIAQLLVGFFVLLCLGKCTVPDNLTHWNPAKATKYTSLSFSSDSFQFVSPSHKADHLFKGNVILLMKSCHALHIDTPPFPLLPSLTWHFISLQLPTVAVIWWIYPFVIFLCSLPAYIFWQQYWWTINARWWCHHISWDGLITISYSGHQPMVLWCLQNIHTEKPCPNPGFIACMWLFLNNHVLLGASSSFSCISLLLLTSFPYLLNCKKKKKK